MISLQTTRAKKKQPGGKRKKMYDIQFNMKLSKSMYSELYSKAIQEGVDMSIIVRSLITKHLKRWPS